VGARGSEQLRRRGCAPAAVEQGNLGGMGWGGRGGDGEAHSGLDLDGGRLENGDRRMDGAPAVQAPIRQG